MPYFIVMIVYVLLHYFHPVLHLYNYGIEIYHKVLQPVQLTTAEVLALEFFKEFDNIYFHINLFFIQYYKYFLWFSYLQY